MKKQTTRAILTGVGVFITGMAIYQHPPMTLVALLDASWQPFLQAVLATLVALGVNMKTRTR